MKIKSNPIIVIIVIIVLLLFLTTFKKEAACDISIDPDCDGITSDDVGLSISNWITGAITREKLGYAIMLWIYPEDYSEPGLKEHIESIDAEYYTIDSGVEIGQTFLVTSDYEMTSIECSVQKITDDYDLIVRLYKIEDNEFKHMTWEEYQPASKFAQYPTSFENSIINIGPPLPIPLEAGNRYAFTLECDGCVINSPEELGTQGFVVPYQITDYYNDGVWIEKHSEKWYNILLYDWSYLKIYGE